MARKEDANKCKDNKNTNKSGYRSKGNKKNKDSVKPSYKEMDKEDYTSEGRNDIKWWIKNEDLGKQVANIPFTAATGLKNKAVDADIQLNRVQTAPGMMALNTILTPGYATNVNDAVNLSARQIYSFVRHENSGHANYDPADMMEYILALDQAYALVAELTRLVGVYNYYNGLNRYIARDLIHAMGYDYDDINGRLPELVAIINRFILDLNTKYVPANIDLIERHYWMFSNLFLDTNSLKGQIYFFKPVGFFKRRESNTHVEPGLDFAWYCKSTDTGWNAYTGRRLGVNDIKAFIQTIMNPISLSEDCGIISGDILKAYGTSVMRMSIVTTDYTIAPVYNTEALMQIENAIIAPHIRPHDPIKIEQANGVFRSDFTDITILDGDYKPVSAKNNRTLNFHTDEVTYKEVVIATRLHSKWEVTDDDGTGTHAMSFTGFGTEIVAGAEVYFYEFLGSEGDSPTLVANDLVSNLFVNSSSDVLVLANQLAALESFAQHPILTMESTVSGAAPVEGNSKTISVVTDYDNWTAVDWDVIANINDYCIRSIYGVDRA